MLSPDLLAQVRLYSDLMDAEAASIDELLEEVLAGAPVEAAPRSPRRGWVVALAAAVAVFLVVGGLALAFRLLRSEAPVVDEPDPTPVETLDSFVVEDVPSFVATIEYGLDNPDVISGVIEVSYRRVDDGLRLEYVVESVAWIAGPSYQPGDFLVWDNSQVAFDNAIEGRHVYETTSEFTGLAGLAWATGWSDACAPNSIETLSAGEIAGIGAMHIRCTTIDGVVELWIDEETGVVLALMGAGIIGPRGAPEGVATEQTGGYTMTAIIYLDEPAFDPTLFEFPDMESPGEVGFVTVPGMHVVMRHMTAAEIVAEETVETEIGADSSRTTETWYVDDDRWRMDVLDAQGLPLGGPWVVGSYTVQLEGERLVYFADADGFVIEENNGPPSAFEQLGSTRNFADDPACSQDPDTTYLGRPVQHFVCRQVGGLSPGEEAAAQRLGMPETITYLIDEETGLVLKWEGAGGSLEVLSIEFDAEIDDTLFSMEPPSGATSLYEDPRPSGILGQAAPLLEGTMLDGGTYTSSTWAGRRVAVLFWASWCDACVDAIQAMQTASDRNDDIEFVTVLNFDDPQEGRDAVAVIRATLPVVDDSQTVITEAWQAWDWPWLVLVDDSSTVVQVRGGGLSDFIATNFDDILNNAPW